MCNTYKIPIELSNFFRICIISSNNTIIINITYWQKISTININTNGTNSKKENFTKATKTKYN
jgi:hypothetical protein